MTIKTSRYPRTKWKNYVRKLEHGVKLVAEVSPCVFMHRGYPLQITIMLSRRPGEHLGDAHAVDRSKNAFTYTKADVEQLLAMVRVAPCPRCSAPAFDPASVKTNRGGLCETCFVSEMQAKYEAEVKAEQQKIAARDRTMLRKGMAVRITAWVHPEDGEDYQVDWYAAERPTAAQIAKRLCELGSCCLDDYHITEL